MAMFLTIMCSIFIPTGMSLMVLSISQHWPLASVITATTLAILGLVGLFPAFKLTIDEEKRHTDIQDKFVKYIGTIAKQSAQRQEETLQLLRDINNNIKNVRNEDKHES